MEIEYYQQSQYLGCIDIDDYGNCAIEANNDDGEFWYLVIDTKMGFSRIMEYGPIVPNKEVMEDYCMCAFSRIEWDAKKVVNIIKTFLNKQRKGRLDISQAREINKDLALSQCKSIIEYMADPEAY